MKPEEEFKEKNILKRLEKDAAEWQKETARVPEGTGALSFPEFETARLEAGREEQERIAAGIASEIENAYQVLEASPQSRSSLLYLTTDLTGDADTSQILQAHPAASWLRCCRELAD